MKQFWVAIALTLIFIAFGSTTLYAQEMGFKNGAQAYLKKDYKAATGYLKEYVAVIPDPGAYYLLGYSTYQLSRKAHGERKLLLGSEAADYFDEAYLIDPGFSPKNLAFGKSNK